jgi:hypothetical protein
VIFECGFIGADLVEQIAVLVSTVPKYVEAHAPWREAWQLTTHETRWLPVCLLSLVVLSSHVWAEAEEWERYMVAGEEACQ